MPPGIHGYPDFEGMPYDPKKARELLAEAGFPEGRGFPDVELLYPKSCSGSHPAEGFEACEGVPVVRRTADPCSDMQVDAGEFDRFIAAEFGENAPCTLKIDAEFARCARVSFCVP